MSSIRPTNGPCDNGGALVHKFIGTAYDVVKRVYDSIGHVDTVAVNIDKIDTLAEAIDAINALYADLDALNSIYNDLGDLNAIADALDELNEIGVNLQEIMYVYELVKTKGFIITVDSTEAMTALDSARINYARVYSDSSSGYSYVDYAFMEGNLNGIPAHDSTTGTWIAIGSSTNALTLNSIAKLYTSTVNQTTLVLDEEALGVSAIYVEGIRQHPDQGFTYNSANRTVTFAEAFDEAGLEIVVIASGVYIEGQNTLIDALKGNTGATLVGTSSGSTVQVELDNKVAKIDLASSVGAGLVGWRRNKFSILDESTVERQLNDTKVTLHDFASYVTDKPDATDPNTWDWAPALSAAAAYIALYQEWKLLTTTRWSSVTLVVTPGAYPIRSKVVINYETYTGAVTGKPIFSMEMDGSIFISEVANDYMIEFHGIELYLVRPKATMGGGKYGYLFKFGNENELTNHANSVTGTIIRPWASGFTKNLVYGWGFDQIIINPYFTSMKQDPLVTDVPATCFEVKKHVMDNCNNITVIRCQFETTSTTNYEAIRIEGNSTSSAHHNFRFIGSHVEPHIRGAKAIAVYSNGNTSLATATFDGVFTENGDNDFPPASTNFVVLQNTMGVTFTDGSHIVSNNKTTDAYNPAVHKSVIKVTGNSPTTRFNGVYFTNAFTNVGSSSADIRASIDTSEHNAGKYAVSYYGAINDHRRVISNVGPVYTGTGANGNRKIAIFNSEDGRTIDFSYTSDVYGTIGTWTSLLTIDYQGVVTAPTLKATYMDASVFRMGYNTGVASNKSIEMYTDGSNGSTAPVRLVGSAAGTATLISAGTTTLSAAGGVRFSGNLTPVATGSNLATTSIPINNGYFQNSPIIVSDIRYKDLVLNITNAEIACAKACGKLFRTYKLKEAMAEKGDDLARRHIGVLAQDIIACFDNAGLDWKEYGIVTHTEWEADEGEILEWEDLYEPDYSTIEPIYETIEVDGEEVKILIGETEPALVLVRAAGSQVIREPKEAGDKYMVRYEELLCFINAGMYAWLEKLESKIDSMS